MSRPPLIYGPDGNSTLVAADDQDEKIVAAAIVAFGALKGVVRYPGQGPSVIEGDDLERYREYAANKLLDALGPEPIEKGLGVRLSRQALRGGQDA